MVYWLKEMLSISIPNSICKDTVFVFINTVNNLVFSHNTDLFCFVNNNTYIITTVVFFCTSNGRSFSCPIIDIDTINNNILFTDTSTILDVTKLIF